MEVAELSALLVSFGLAGLWAAARDLELLLDMELLLLLLDCLPGHLLA